MSQYHVATAVCVHARVCVSAAFTEVSKISFYLEMSHKMLQKCAVMFIFASKFLQSTRKETMD